VCGGPANVRDKELLLRPIRGIDSGLESQAASYLVGICRLHPFDKNNSRAAPTVLLVCLGMEGGVFYEPVEACL
jgi:prophage maintenance system killer protein